ncbi:non-ribosomal peptide synthetase [Streptomyces sp. SID4928]|uniref:non-ribosomal peptide synthetase n=1 Tax=unclassified Streptomyces TaxID=2593676 RepID=UPI0002034807|nr:non-ribosomal peptide synthetase [Streptomyces sp. ACT-1]EGE39932.1 amino acid adenylation domain protein [Streptomyces sp. ACT-1]MYR48014.1 non-ribosomal peptide synthetase [Streptomyces sp. SID4928]
MTGAPQGLQDILPLSPLQQGLYFLSSYDDSALDVYNVQLGLDLTGPLDTDRLRRAVAALLDRHPNLKAAFRTRRNGDPVTVVPHTVDIPWQETDLSGVDAAERDRRVARLADADRHTRFDLARPPLVRFTAIRLSAERHRLLFTHHHLLLDGWSTARVVQELFALYAADGSTTTLPEVRPYRDYLAWAAAQDTGVDERAWRGALAGLDGPTVIAPGLDGQPQAQPATRDVELSPGSAKALTATARALDVTVPVVVQTLWSLVLADLTGRRDIVSGTTVSGRPAELAGADSMVGLFINTLPVRVRIRHDETLAELVRRTAGEQAALLAHHHVALARIQKLTETGGPLFDTLCVFENYLVDSGPDDPEDAREKEFAGLRVEAVSGRDATHYPLTLVAAPGADGGPLLRLSYRADAIGGREAARIAARLRRAVEEFTADPHRPLPRTDLLTPEERDRVLNTFNADTTDVEPATLPELFERQAAAHPDRPAVEAAGRVLTYTELNTRANRLAHALIATGVGPEDVVGVALRRGADVHIAQLAVGKAGGVFAPLDPDQPAERLAGLIAGSGAAVVLAHSGTDHTPWSGDATVIATDRLPEGLPGHNPTDADRRAPLRLHNGAYLIHTSGSTGRPKGVLVEHRPLVDLITWAHARFATRPGDRVTQFASPSFDVTFAELANSLFAGATLVVVPEEERAGAPLADFLNRAAITLAVIPPTVVASLPLDASLPAGMSLVVGTEALPPEVVRAWADRHRLFNAYGPTEAVVNSATWEVPARWTGGPVPIGPPDVNKRAYVLDDALRPVAPGVLGELYIGGPGLARGYLGRPLITADRFVADPFGAPGTRMYRTGDLARWNERGELEYAGRTDHQLKIRGFRVEPGEVEARLTDHPAIAQAVVTGHTDHRGVRRLVAHAVPAPGGDPRPADIVAWAAEGLPDHMVPAAVVLLDALPLTAANKTDRSALPAPDFTATGAGTAPRTDREKELAALFADILHLPEVGVEESFFALGGDSISAIQLVGAARRRGLRLSPRDVFERRTVEQLASLARTVDDSAPPVERAARSAPLTPVLRWLVERGGPIADYHQSTVLHTPAGTTAAQLTAGLGRVLDHHDVLRARLTDRTLEIPAPGEPGPAPLTRIDAVETADADLLPTLRTGAREAARLLDPYTGTMVRAVWLDAGPDRGGLLALLIHHAVVDGVSWRILTQDLAASLEAERHGRTVELPPVETSFADWAQGLGQAALAPERVAEAAHWTAVLGDGGAMLPAPDPALDTLATVTTVPVELAPEHTLPLLTDLPERFHTGPDTFLVSALALALAAWRGDSEPVLVDIEGHGRADQLVPDAELSRTVGWFTAVHPVRLDLGGLAAPSGDGLTAALKRVKEQLRAAPDSGLGFGLLRHLNPDLRDRLAALPEPRVAYNYLGRFGATGAAERTGAPAPWSPALTGSLGGGADDALPAPHTLTLNASVVDGPQGPALHAGFSFPGRLLETTGVERLAALWTAALRDLARLTAEPADGGHTPGDFPLVEVDQPEIDALEARGPLADLLPLSPLQAGLYFLSGFGAEGDGPDVYTTQTVLDIEGDLDAERLRRAGRAVLDRHPNLRAGFLGRRGADPLQVVPAGGEIPVHAYDLTSPDLSEGRRQGRAQNILAADRRQGFDLTAPPLLRLTLVRLGEHRHLLAVTSHHILLDGWSGPLLVRDLLALYRGAPGPAPRPYRDYLLWLSGRDRAATRGQWQEALAGIDGPTRLVPEAAAMPAGTPERVDIPLPDDLVARVHAFVRAHDVTVSTVLQGAWGLLLGRLTGRTDVTFGVTVSGRPADLDGSHDMIGLFINTVPTRVTPRPDQTLAALVRQLGQRQALLMDHQYEPLAELQRLAGHRELFDTLVLFENFPVDAEQLRRTEEAAGLLVTGARGHDATHYPLVLVALPGRDRLALALDHRPELLTADRVATIGAQLVSVLEQLVDHPESTAATVLPALAEPARLDGPARAVTPLGLAGRFLRRAAETPAATALIAGDEEWSYADLAARVTAVAGRLRELGARPERLIAVALPRSADLVAVLLAVSATGAAYVPVDPDFPADRVAHLLADSDPLLVIRPGHPVLAPGPHGGTRAELPGAAPDPESTAYVIHTSGSTGNPKGVVITHGALANLLDAIAKTLGSGPGHRLLAVTTVSFDIAALELFVPLVTGAAVVLAQREEVLDPLLLSGLAERTRATHLQATPSLWRGIIDAAPGLLDGLCVLSGGEPLPADLADRLARGGARLLNLYGPTETTIWSTAADLAPDSGTPHVGHALRNTALRVLDTWLRPVPPGVPGELYIGGAGLARGYLGRGALTASRFTADPFGAPGDRMYRTGDLARIQDDGTLRVLGRTDHQLKVRGHRVEPGEIETALRSHPEVTDTVVVGLPDPSGSVRLVAYVTGAATELRPYLAQRLPEHLVPSVVVRLPALPLTPNGKVDRAALPAPQASGGERTRAPRDAREAVLGELFADVLGLDRAGPDDDFFHLGGHSLLAMQLANRLRSTLGVDVALRDIFEHPTPAALAGTVLPRPAARTAPVRRERRPGERIPLSFAQSRLWFLHRLDGPSATYNLFIVVRLGGELDREALRLAVGDVVTRHESLRTVYPDADGLPHQHILDEESARAACDRSFAEVAEVAEADLAAALRARVTRPVDIIEEIPLRAQLLRTGNDHVLALTLHHIAGDEWSMRPLVDDLRTAYTARVTGADHAWEPLPVDYADYALWQREALGELTDPTSQVARQAAFWERTLAGSPDELALPYDRPRPAEETHEGATVTFAVDPAVHADLRSLAARNGTSVFMAVQAALAVLLSAHGAGTDIPLGTPVAGRTDEKFDDLIGFFVNTLVLRTDLSGRPTFHELLARVRDTDLAAFDHADLPFEQLVDIVAPERTLARNPLFQVMLVFQNVSGDDTFTLPGLDATPVSADPGVAKLDLQFTLAERPDGAGITGMLIYQTSLFDHTTAQALADRYVTLLAALVARPELPVHRAAVLSPPQRAGVLAASTGDERPLPHAPLPRLLAERYAAGATAPALIDDGISLGFEEFDGRVGRLAALLRDRGVGPETRVAVALPRSADLVVALHAVQRAGGAYVPVDPDHPADRVAHMLADAGPRLLITLTALRERLPVPGDVPVLELDAPDARAACAAAAPVGVHPGLRGEHAAYVLYTSGSTGRPKAVVVTHTALVNRLRWMAGHFPFGPEDRVLQKTPAGFDVSVWEFFLPMLTGSTLVVLPDGLHRDPAEVAEAVIRHGVTTVHFVPSMLAAFAAEPRAAHCTGLRRIIASGEALSAALARTVRAVLPGASLHNLYGPTEAAIDVTAWEATGEPGGSVPIGTPVHNTGAYVLDAGLRPVPDGVTGELYLSGPQLARGYLGRPGLTADRFVAHPFGAPGERLYRTGDLVRRRADGALVYVGRTDGQIKLRGLRVELGEIEAVIAEEPRVAASAVVLREDTPGRPVLTGYLVPATGTAPDPREITERIARRLPDHMVPTALITLDALPLTPSGKLDRTALPAPDLAATASAVAPRGIREAVLTAVFAELLGIPAAGAEDSFFALGGDSILSIQLVARARRAGMALTPRDVFEHKTPAALARAAATAGTTSVPRLDPAGRAPLTPIMRWALQHGPIDGLHQYAHLVTPPEATRATLTEALTRLMERHPMLRAALVGEEGDRALHIPGPADPAPEPVLLHVDAGAESAQRAAELTAALAAEAVDQLDPAAGELVRTVWCDRGPGRGGRLVLVVHHLAVDGVSWRILTADLAAAHDDVLAGNPAAPPGGSTSFRQWALGLADAATAPARRAEAPVWRAREERDVPALGARPLDPALDTQETVAHLERTLDRDLTRALLTRVPAAVHGSVHDVLVAATALALDRRRRERGRRAGRDVIAVEGHGREENAVPGAELSTTVGWFTSWYPVAPDLGAPGRSPSAGTAGDEALRALMAVKEHLRETPDRGIGHGLLHHLDDPAGPSRTPEVVLNYLGRFPGPAGTADGAEPAAWSPAPEALPALRPVRNTVPVLFPLEIIASTVDGPDGPRLATRWTYATGILDAEDAERLLDLWCEALHTLADTPSGPVHTPSDFPLVRLDQGQVDALQARSPGLRDVWPLTPLQEGLYALTHLAGDDIDVYTMQLVLRLAGRLDPAALRRAAADLLDRNPGLRTAFVAAGGRPVQTVLDGVAPDWSENDLRPEPAHAREEALRALAEDDRTRPFDLTAPPLLRLRLVRTGEGEHALLVTNHHAILDGWSVPVLIQELLSLYASLTGPAEPPLGRRSFRDFLAWRTAQDEQAAQAAWRSALDGVTEPTLIAPADPGRRPALPDRIQHRLDATLRERLQTLARSADVTLNTVIQFAWGLLLARHTGREDVVFGATVSGRPPEIDDVETMTGLFINTLPVRVDLRAGGTVRQALARLQAEQAKLSGHQHLGLADIQRSTGAGELFDTLLVFENYFVDGEGLRRAERSGELTVTGSEHTDATHYPLTLAVVPGGHLTLEYRPDLFGPEQAAALMERFAHLLADIGSRPDTRVHGLQALAPDERRRILDDWNPAPRPHPEQTLPGLFAEAAAVDPGAPALVRGDTVLSFRDVTERAARLAHELIARGVGPEDLVALMLPRTEEMLISILAVHQAGAAYLPLDPDYPAERVAFMLADASPAVLLTTTALAGRAGHPATVLLDDPGTRAALATRSVRPPTDAERARPLRPENPAYLIYTSGSTGTPKGVVVTHRSVVNLFHSHRRALYEPVVERTGRSRLHVGHAWSFSFDASWQPQLWMFHGHCVHVLTEDVQRDPDRLHRYLRDHAIDFIEVAPTVLAQLEEAGLTEGGSCPLPLLGVGGEAVPDGQWARLRELPGTDVVNLYGPTEGTVDAMIAHVRDSERQLIGRAVDNARVHLLDAGLRPVPTGVPGEMYLAGAGLARGYRGRAALTSERFVADPFGADGGRLYRTGDLGRWTVDGAVEFLGRVDDQVKIRGFRIEPGEIETVAAAHPDLSRVAVVAREDAGVRRLVAYGVPRPGGAPDPLALRAWLAERLPGHLVPAAVVLLDALPVTANAKLDRDRLPAPDFGAAAGGREPVGERERAVCAAMAQVLALPRIGADDDFFALGGDSVVTVRLAGLLRSGGWEAAPRDVFRHRTAAGLAAGLRRQDAHSGG